MATEQEYDDILRYKTNGDERLNQTLVATLKKVVDARSDDWDRHIPAALYTYRILKQSLSKFSPFFLMFNHYPRKAVSLAIEDDSEIEDDDEEIAGDGDSDEEEAEDIDTVMERLLNIRDRCHHKAKENISAAQEK